MKPPSVDFGDTSTFQTHGAKKNKQAQKKADQAKWAKSDDEGGTKEGGEGEGTGGGAGGSNNGDGGAGGDDDDWGNSGKKKKGRKGKGGVDAEEEKRKKEEEEKKRKEEEEKQKQEEDDAPNGGNSLSWADSVGDANPDDEWAGFTATTKKGKKNNKKGKVSLENGMAIGLKLILSKGSRSCSSPSTTCAIRTAYIFGPSNPRYV